MLRPFYYEAHVKRISLGFVLGVAFLTTAVVADTHQDLWEAPIIKGTSGREVIEATVGRVNGNNIYLSDLRRPQMEKEGQRATLFEQIDKQVLLSRAASLSLVPSEAEVQKQIEAFRAQFKGYFPLGNEQVTADAWLAQHNMTNKDLARFYREEIAINNCKHFYSVDKPLIPRDEIEEYYRAHPVKTEAAYKIKTALLDEEHAASFDPKSTSDVEWIDLDWVPESKIAEEMNFVKEMEIGTASAPIKTSAGYQTVFVEEKKQPEDVPLAMRVAEIERILSKEHLQKALDLFMNDLKNNASVVVFDPI